MLEPLTKKEREHYEATIQALEVQHEADQAKIERLKREAHEQDKSYMRLSGEIARDWVQRTVKAEAQLADEIKLKQEILDRTNEEHNDYERLTRRLAAQTVTAMRYLEQALRDALVDGRYPGWWKEVNDFLQHPEALLADEPTAEEEED